MVVLKVVLRVEKLVGKMEHLLAEMKVALKDWMRAAKRAA